MDGKKCSECGEILVEQQIIPVIPHADNDNDGMCDMCGDEVSQSTAEQFVAAVQSIESATGNSEKFEAINNAISLYNALTDEQKASVAAEYMQLQTAVEQYNEFVNDVNTQSANALQSVLLSTAFMAAALAAFLFLLEQKLL